jgi:hypothetical protein
MCGVSGMVLMLRISGLGVGSGVGRLVWEPAAGPASGCPYPPRLPSAQPATPTVIRAMTTRKICKARMVTPLRAPISRPCCAARFVAGSAALHRPPVPSVTAAWAWPAGWLGLRRWGRL